MRRWLLAFVAALGLGQPANAAWREASTDHFVIYSEQSADSLREYAGRLERFDKAMRVIRGVPDEPMGAATRLTVYVVRDLATVRKLFGDGASSSRFSIAGFYLPRAGGSIAITPRSAGGNGKFDLDAETVLLHEYAHHFMMHTFPGAFPAWFIEGFAEFNSTAKFDKDGGVGLGMPALHRAYGLVLGDKLPVEKMMTNDVADLKPAQRDALYGRGWLLTHYLTFEKARAGQLTDYIRRLNQGAGSLDAAKAAFGDLKQLDKDLDKYLMRKRVSYWPLKPESVPIGPVRIRDLSPAEDAVMDVKIRSRRGVNEAQARELLPLVRRAAAPFPSDAAAQTTLAEAEYDARNYSEAEAAADRAIAVDPRSVDGLLYKARARMALASRSGDRSPATWNGIRKLIIAANKADLDDPEPMIHFYRSFAAQGVAPTANATAGLLKAFADAPQDRSLRMMAAFQLLTDGKSVEARKALAPIAFDPHGGRMAEAAALILAKLDAGGNQAALALARGISEAPDDEGSDEGDKGE